MRDTSSRPAIQGAAPPARIRPPLAQLHDDGTARDRAGDRQLFYDQYVGLLLLYFFHPALTSLNALRQATELDAVQRWLGPPKRISIGSLSEAAGVFDPDLLRSLLAHLARQVAPTALPNDRDALRHLTAVDGTLRPVLPRLAHPLWGDAGRLSAKLHLHVEVGRGLPVDATVTPAASSAIAQLEGALQAGRLYVTDRGYASCRLLADILAAGSSFVARLRGDAAFRGAEREVPVPARAAGVVRDVTVDRLGVGADVLGRAVRVVVVQPEPGGGRSDTPLVLVTDRLDPPAELVTLAYRWRWHMEKNQADCPSSEGWIGTRGVGDHRRDGLARARRVAPTPPRGLHRRNPTSDTARRPAPPRG